jgi:hypothetical protein
MTLSDEQVHKVDPLLGEALAQAEADEVLTAVMVLGPEGGREATGDEPRPAQKPRPELFETFEEYRRALLDRQMGEVSGDIGPTLQQLQDLSLAPRGGKTSRSVVVQGPARQILRSLELPGVRHASLDRTISVGGSVARGPGSGQGRE